MMKV
jgi:hypothetical protein